MRKSIDYYMALPWKVQVVRVPESEGGGYMACIPQLGSYAFVGDGDTEEEALADLEKVKRMLFKDYLKEGVVIPAPGEGKPYVKENKLRKTVEKARPNTRKHAAG